MRTLTHAQARAAYDRIGRGQDAQAFYEDGAVAAMLAHADLGAATSVLEFGCGTGRLARRLLASELPGDARYLGVDVSPKMVALARERVAAFADRAQIRLTDGAPCCDVPAGSIDRFLSAYVLDLLSEEDIGAALEAAHRALRPGGLACLVCITHPRTLRERALSAVAGGVHRLRPQLVGGCRPISVASFLHADRWRTEFETTMGAFGVRSEIVVAATRVRGGSPSCSRGARSPDPRRPCGRPGPRRRRRGSPRRAADSCGSGRPR